MGVMSVGSLSGYLELEDRLSPALRLAERNLATTGARLDELGDRLKRTGSDLLPLSAGLLAAGGASSVMAATFDASMTRLVSVAGVADDEINMVREHILALAPASGIGPQALADAMTKVSSTVSNTSTALSILNIAAQGTKAGFGATIDVAGALTTVINSYGAANITAARAGDILAQAIKEGGAEAKELAPTLANVVPFAAQLGVSFEEVAANIATLTKLGVPTAEAVTQLTSVFTALSKETNQGTEALKAMGTSYGAIREQIREKGLAATLTDLAQRFKGNETVMLDVFGRIEAVKNIMGTAGVQAETYAEVLKKVQGSSDKAGGALKGMADAMSGKTVQTWGELTATVSTLAIKVGDVLAPALGEMMRMAMPVLEWAESAVKWFAELPRPVQTLGLAVLGLTAVAGPALFALGTISSIAGVASTGLGLLTGAVATMTGVSQLAVTKGLSPMIVGMSASGAAAATAAPRVGMFWAAVTGPIGIAVAVASAIGLLVSLRGAMRSVVDEADTQTTRIKNLTEQLNAPARQLADINVMLSNGPTLTVQQYARLADQLVALKAAGETLTPQMEQLIVNFGRAGGAAGGLGSSVPPVSGAITILSGAVKEHNEEIKKLVANLSGVGAIQKIKDLMEATKMAGGVTKLSKAGQLELNEALTEFIKAGGLATEQMKDLELATRPVLKPTTDLQAAFSRWTLVGDRSNRTLLNSLDLYKAMPPTVAAMQRSIDLNNFSVQGFTTEGLIPAYRSMDTFRLMMDKATVASGINQRVTETLPGTYEKVVDVVSRIEEALDQSAQAWHRLADATDSASVRMMAAITSGAAIIVKDIKGILEAKDAIGAVLAVANLAVDAIALMWDALTRSPGEDVMRRVRGWGVDITEALGDSIAETAKKLFGGSRQAAEIFRLGDILDAAGGLTSGNFDTFLGKLRDTFVMLETGAFTSGQAVEVLDENFGAFATHATQHGRLVSDRFLEIIRLADAAGIRVEAINKFVIGQATSAVTGLNALITNSTITSQTAANGLTAALGASFDELTKRGMSAADAIAMMGPTIDALEIQLVENGLVGSAAFAEIRAMSVLAADEIGGPLLDAIHGGAQAITGLHNAGILTQEMFSGLTAQVTSTFNSLVEQGYDGAVALALVGRDIQKIWEAQQDFGLEVDDSTQRLIDQAIEAGKVGEAHRDAQDRAVRAMEGAAVAMQRVGDTLERVFGSAGDDSEKFADRVREAIEGIPTEVRVGVHFDVDQMPNGAGPYDFGPNADEWSTPGEREGGYDYAPGPAPNSNADGSEMSGIVDMLGSKISDLTSSLPSLMENAVRHGVQTAGRRI